MKKMIGLLMILCCMGTMCLAQSTEVKVNEDKTSSMTVKECAKKMGMTEAECKAKCAKICSSSKSSAEANGVTNEMLVNFVSDENTQAPKACCGSIEECAKKMGMTVAECKAICGMVHTGESAADAQTRVASASDERGESTPTPVSTKGKKCSKGSKACCSKKK